MPNKLRLNVLSAREVREIEETNADDLMEYYNDIANRKNLSLTTWSMYEVGHRMFKSALVPNGNPIVVAYNGGWGTAGQVTLGYSPKWITIWRACEKLITQSGDSHHIFIEDFEIKGNTLRLITGS